MSLFSVPISNLKGVGKKRAPLFQKIGALSVGALLRLYPRTYEDWNHRSTVSDAVPGTVCAIRATVSSIGSPVRVHGGMILIKGTAEDETGILNLTFFNNPYIPHLLIPDSTYIFYGKVTENFGHKEMASPAFLLEERCTGLRPIYPQTKGLTSRMIENAVREALRLLPETIKDPIPSPLRKEEGLCYLRFALENIHCPKDTESMETARRRLIFEELLVLQLGLLSMKSHTREKSKFCVKAEYTKEFWGLLPFSPTNAQKRAVEESIADLMSGNPMNRLIQGDVGSGKTVVAAALCHTMAKNKIQSALMVPTDILAHQHFASLSPLLGRCGIRVGLLTGSMKAKEKREIKSALLSGEIDVLIGTHAILTQDVQFQNLGLVITDEQHRFGVRQRAELAEKSKGTHVLVMSATPIPRTLALIIYGDLDLSVIDELPPGRQKIKTFWITGDKRRRAIGFLEKQVKLHRQCYVICPMIEDGSEKASVTGYAKKLKKELPSCRIGALHGRMKATEKDKIMEDFSAGNLDILVSTTVVEVGVDVPNATVMLIENAEQYGLSQLHQLRGRVGRGKFQSYCILISDAQNDNAQARMKAMCETQDGFEIADRDLKLRGPGDFFGDRQHGLPQLKIADINTDLAVLKRTQTIARSLLAEDPELKNEDHRGLCAEVRLLFQSLESS
ncbi:ATP-dependent DNA helicase RecG [Caproicibacterium sp. BJN0003]|uniref:ATP-dependent DNA helicase RecG n=1 Tax=Caproicibacterium sp. BJN0003 TaxID=2994078 RepID=UPI00225AE6D0|nr:ATP-dependent DNA helicase RecG [Caproicibacterium sp. BJN0003]UZT82548.1 ATP-dependent DNA helicase RecG [Caproicibacterium sp. BJN0003]